jgi:pilus assembly protein Flp/PilA
MNMLTSAIKRFIADEEGVTAIEYGLIAALIGVAIATAAATIGADIKTAFDYIAEKLPNSAPTA